MRWATIIMVLMTPIEGNLLSNGQLKILWHWCYSLEASNPLCSKPMSGEYTCDVASVTTKTLTGRIYGNASQIQNLLVTAFLLGISGQGMLMTFLCVRVSLMAFALYELAMVYSHEFGYPHKRMMQQGQGRGQAGQGWHRLPWQRGLPWSLLQPHLRSLVDQEETTWEEAKYNKARIFTDYIWLHLLPMNTYDIWLNINIFINYI